MISLTFFFISVAVGFIFVVLIGMLIIPFSGKGAGSVTIITKEEEKKPEINLRKRFKRFKR